MEDLAGRPVLVLDGEERAALATVRSLGSRGAYVIVGASSRCAMSFYSKYAYERIIYPNPLKSADSFIKWLKLFVKKRKPDVIFPFTDQTAVLLSKSKDLLERYSRVCVPSWEIFRKAFDKLLTIVEAKKAGIPCPNTWVVSDLSDLRRISKEITYPAVIKPRRKIVWHDDKAIMVKVTRKNYVHSINELIYRYELIIRQYPVLKEQKMLPLVQEYIEGIGLGFEALISQKGKLLTFFMHRRLHEYPVTGGASTLRESIYDKELFEYGIRFLKAIGWNGVAMVEFKKKDKPCLMEINGRFWGSLPLAINAGVDFPYLCTLMLLGMEKRNYKYKLGFRQKWGLPGEILWLYGKMYENITKKASITQLFCNIYEFAKSFIMTRDDVLSLRDLRPFVGSLLTTIEYAYDVIKGRRTVEGERIL